MTNFRITITVAMFQLRLLPNPTTIAILLLSQCWCLLHGFAIQPPSLSSSRKHSLIYNNREYQNNGGKVSLRHLYLQPASIYNLNRGRRRDLTIQHASQQHDHNKDESASPTSLRIGIVGAGSIAFGTASLAASLGHDPMIWSPSGTSTRALLDNRLRHDNDDASPPTASIQSTGALDHNFNVRIARSSKELVKYNDNVLVLALPVNGHRKVMEELAPEIMELIMERKYQQQQLQKEDKDHGRDAPVMMHIIISSHASLGGVYFMQLLQQERLRLNSSRRKNHYQSQKEDINSQGMDNHVGEDIGVRITAWGTTAVTARKTSGTSVNVLTVRQCVDFCTVPSAPDDIVARERNVDDGMSPLTKTTKLYQLLLRTKKQILLSDGNSLCSTLFGPRFQRREGGLLAISLSNLNPQNHLGIVLGNMSRMDQPPPPPPPLPADEMDNSFDPKTASDVAIEPWYQAKNITPNIGRLMEALDRERLAIAKALGIDVRTIYEHFSWSFHVPMETLVIEEDEECNERVRGDSSTSSFSSSSSATPMKKTRPLTVSEMNQQMHHYLEKDVLGPSTPDSRYVLEDVPYGLVLTVILGRLVGCPLTLHESGIRILSAMYGRNFMAENELLQGLGLIVDEDGCDNIPSLDKWREMSFSGSFL